MGQVGMLAFNTAAHSNHVANSGSGVNGKLVKYWLSVTMVVAFVKEHQRNPPKYYLEYQD